MNQYSGMRKKNWMAAMLVVVLLMGSVGVAMADDLGLTTTECRTIWSNYSNGFTTGKLSGHWDRLSKDGCQCNWLMRTERLPARPLPWSLAIRSAHTTTASLMCMSS